MFQSPRSPCRRLSMPSTMRCWLLIGMGSLLMGTFCGCGAGEYERRKDKRVTELLNAAKFNILYQAQALEGFPVSVRIPMAFTSPPMIEGRSQVDLHRIKPNVITLPWLKLTYEMTVKDTKGQMPYYCYVAATKAADNPLQDVCDALRKELKAKPGNDVTEWVDFPSEKPDGSQDVWKKLRCSGPQEFAYIDSGPMPQAHMETLPGILEIYVREDNGYIVLIGWRVPTSIASSVDLAKWAPLVTGCVSVQP
jgi:hypothetical protein